MLGMHQAFVSNLRTELKSVTNPKNHTASLSIEGRYLLRLGREYPCRTVRISPEILTLVAPVVGNLNDRVVVYLEKIGRFEGPIIQQSRDGFSIGLTMTRGRRAKLAELLRALSTPPSSTPAKSCPGPISGSKADTVITLGNGDKADANLIYVSASDALIDTEMKLEAGHWIYVGCVPACVVDNIDGRIRVYFHRGLSLAEIEQDICVPL